MAYVYLIFTGAYALIWLIFFAIRKDLRHKIVVSSLFAAPLGVFEVFFIPEYWTPAFQTINLFGDLFLESLLFCFFLGGVVPVFYQVVCKEPLFKFPKINPFLTFIGPALFLLYFFKIYELPFMYYVFISMFVGSFIVMYYLGKSSKKLIYAAGINILFYIIVFSILWHLFPQLSASYSFQNLSGIQLNGMPIEEFLWIASFALFWTPLYEIWEKYVKKG